MQKSSPGIIATIGSLTGGESQEEIADLVRKIIASGNFIEKASADLQGKFIFALQDSRHELFLNEMYIAIVNHYGYEKKFCRRSLYTWSRILNRSSLVTLAALHVAGSYALEENWWGLAVDLFNKIFRLFEIDAKITDEFRRYFTANKESAAANFFAGIFRLVVWYIKDSTAKTFCGAHLIDWHAALCANPEANLFLQTDQIVFNCLGDLPKGAHVLARTLAEKKVVQNVAALPLYNMLAEHDLDLFKKVKFWVACIKTAKEMDVSLLSLLINSGIHKSDGKTNLTRQKLLANLASCEDLNTKIVALAQAGGAASEDGESSLKELKRIKQYFDFLKFIYVNGMVNIGVAHAFIGGGFDPLVCAEKVGNNLAAAFLKTQTEHLRPTTPLRQRSQTLIGSRAGWSGGLASMKSKSVSFHR